MTGSDDYTDYLFMTAALTNSRVAPLLNPSEEELRRLRNGNSFVFKCRNSRKELAAGDRTVDEYSHTIVALKAIERAPDLFRPTSFGGCRCKEGAILVDYEYAVSCAEDWTMHTWCPDCGARREFKVRNFDLEKSCSSFLAGVEREFDKGVGAAALGCLR